jgi:hypothetical protein
MYVPGKLRKTTETLLRAEIRTWCPRVTYRIITKLKALSTSGRQSIFLILTTYRQPLCAVHYRVQCTPEIKQPDHQAKHLHIVPRMRVCGAVPPWRVQGRLNLYDPWHTTSVLICSICVLDSGFTWLMSRTLTRSRSECPRGLRCESPATRLLGLRVRFPPSLWMSVSCECCMLSSRVICDGSITRSDLSYRMWCVWVWSWNLNHEET